MELDLFTLNTTDCKLNIIGLTDQDGLPVEPDTSCTDITIDHIDRYVISIVDCEESTRNIAVCKEPVPSISMTGCSVTEGVATLTINFNPNTPNWTLLNAYFIAGGNSTTVSGFPLTLQAEQETSFVVNFMDACGNSWVSSFEINYDLVGGPVYTCEELQLINNGTTRINELLFEVGEQGEIIVTDDGQTLSDGVYIVSVTMYYVDNNDIAQTYTSTTAFLHDCHTSCAVYKCALEKLSIDKEEALEIYMLYDAVKSLILCDMDKACEAYLLLANQLERCGFSNCGCH